ncbi:MAG: hypothetical protein C5B50_04250 [Verrucomicrobia bacterium]|nr:MAG: hypothetical protein C5B50_04250 [Verrucomicrobiota bacterium]
MNFTHPHFAEPHWLWLAFVGPLLLLALQLYSARARRRQLSQIAAPQLLESLTRSHSPARRMIKNVLVLLVTIGVGVTLARPQWGEQAQISHLLGRDTVFILDCSRSMLATDVSPSRLQRAKLAILDSVLRHGRGRVGLVAFAGQAFLQCPLTYDYNAFQDTLMSVDEKTIPVPGTDIGRALDEGFHALDKSARQKILVLITDGEDLFDPKLTLAELENHQSKFGLHTAQDLAKQGTTIFTVGVGTPAGAEIQVINDQGKTEMVRDSKGQVVQSRLDETALRQIAQATGGAYYPLGPVGEGLAKVRLGVENLPGPSGSSPGQKLGVDRFQIPLAVVLVFLAGESLIGTRRRGAL